MGTVDFDKIIQMLLPVYLRTTKHIVFLATLLKPLKNIYNTFTSYRTRTLYKIQHTGQVISLAELLNSKFDSQSGGITLSDDTQSIGYRGYTTTDTPIIYMPLNQSEWNSNPTDRHYIGNFVDYLGITIINIPSIAIQPTETNVLNTVEPYRLAGKQFKVFFTPENPG